MINSKQVKEDWLSDKDKCPWCPTGIKKVWWWLDKQWWNCVGRHWYFVKKVWAYAKVLYKDYDFDSAYVYPLLHLKLKRLHDVMENGHVVQGVKEMRALKTCLKLCARLREDSFQDEYYDIPMKRHDAKWGEMETSWEPVEGSTNSRFSSRRPKAVTEEEIEQERKEFVQAYTWSDARRDRDRALLFGLMAKWMPFWWE